MCTDTHTYVHVINDTHPNTSLRWPSWPSDAFCARGHQSLSLYIFVCIYIYIYMLYRYVYIYIYIYI